MLLIIDKSLKNARTVSDMFYYMGILSHASTPERAISEISNRYRAVLILNPGKLTNADEFLKILRNYSLGTPIFAITDGDSTKTDNRTIHSLYNASFSANTYSSLLYSSILTYQKEHNLPLLGEYKLSGLDLSVSRDSTFFEDDFHLTKTESMILRYLIRCYPARAKTKNILKYAFRPEKMPEISNVRTHISIINKKFSTLFGTNIITSEAGSGYLISTPEVVFTGK